ncbi:MAG TPA: glycerophosphodiester phosphodiesterase family protein [Caulobacteraceae bacterium]|nr:glycerophosphodiester phosphodiesterase family protein [Caulobacteraceae bacterium]
MKDRFGDAWDFVFAPAIAHRGLWTRSGPPENSLAAFEAACEAGYGIELDVQLSSDGEAMVFHDSTLARLTGREGRVCDHTAADLAEMTLPGGEETIPTLSETLTLVGRRALVLIELKTAYGEVGPLEQRVHDIIIDHAGPIAIIGFNPYSHAWYADRHPKVLRGLDSHAYRGADAARLAPEQRKSFARLEHVAIARPHFLALGLDMLPSPRADEYRAEGMPVVAWTTRSPDEWDKVSAYCDNHIFEGFQA